MFDLKVIHSVLGELEQERGIPREKVVEAIEQALATAYKKEYGKRGQIVRARFDLETGATVFEQVKIVVDESKVRMPSPATDQDTGEEAGGNEAPMERDIDSADELRAAAEKDERVNFNPEHHILLEDARRIRKDVAVGDEIVFPLEAHEDYGRIAAQTAKQVIIQKIREAERGSVLAEFSHKQGEIVSGTVQRIERGNLFIDLGRTTGILPYEEQIPTERYRQGERIRAYLYAVEETARGVFLRLSRSHPQFLAKLFEIEAPEIVAKTVEIKAIAREAGSRSKVAVASNDPHIDPVGSLVGQRGVRVTTVMSELGGEKIDIIEWSADPTKYIEDALSPAKVMSVTIDETARRAVVEVTPDQQSLAIGKGGQNVRLAAKLTGWKIDIRSLSENGDSLPIAEGEESVGTENVKELEPENSEKDPIIQ
jgi:N utilization substance protein A